MQPAAHCHHADGIALLAAAENLPGVLQSSLCDAASNALPSCGWHCVAGCSCIVFVARLWMAVQTSCFQPMFVLKLPWVAQLCVKVRHFNMETPTVLDPIRITYYGLTGKQCSALFSSQPVARGSRLQGQWVFTVACYMDHGAQVSLAWFNADLCVDAFAYIRILTKMQEVSNVPGGTSGASFIFGGVNCSSHRHKQ